MRLSEIGLLLLAASAVAGLFMVVTGHSRLVMGEEEIDQSTEPLDILQRELSGVMYGPGFRNVPAAPPDTIVRSMDLLDGVSLDRANLHITRTLAHLGFDHVITYRVPERGLSFICRTPEGEPLRLELNNTRL